MLDPATRGAGQLEGSSGFADGNARQIKTGAAGIRVALGREQLQRVEAHIFGVSAETRVSLTDIHQRQTRPDQVTDVDSGLQFAEFALKLDDIFLSNTPGVGGFTIKVDRCLPGHPGQGIRNFAQPGLVRAPSVKKAN